MESKNQIDFEPHKKFLLSILKTKVTNPDFEDSFLPSLYFLTGSLIMTFKKISQHFIDKILESLFNLCLIKNNKIIGFLERKSFSNKASPDLISTYSALCIIKMCGFDPDRNQREICQKLKEMNKAFEFDSRAIVENISKFQDLKTGTFSQFIQEGEKDVRQMYCAFCILNLLGITRLEEVINKELSIKYLKSINNYEGGYSLIDGGESNAGVTFCALGCFKMLDVEVPQKDKVIQWLNMRISETGTNGRTNKINDSCYSFWVFNSLRLLDVDTLINEKNFLEFLRRYESIFGGFSKFSNYNDEGEEVMFYHPDLMHTFYSLACLTLLTQKNTEIKIDKLTCIPIKKDAK